MNMVSQEASLTALKNTASELDLLAMRMGMSWASLNPASLDVFPACVSSFRKRGDIFRQL